MSALIIFTALLLMTCSQETIYAEQVPDSSNKTSNFNIAAVGDWSCNADTQRTVDNILSKDPELTIGLGDYVYNEKNADCWIGKIDPLKHGLKLVVGNHEVKDFPTWMQIIHYLEIDYFGANNMRYYYSFDIQNVHFLVMSEYSPLNPGSFPSIYQKQSEQYGFVKEDLRRSAANASIDWIIVSHHRQEYASSWGKILYPVSNWAEIYHPLFEEYGVDLVLQGHQHNYQRTFPIKYNINNSDHPILTEINTNIYQDPLGQIFVTVGTGGVQLQKLNGKAYYTASQIIEHGFLNIEIMKNGKILNATFYSNDGSVTDSFVISK